jgi:hypothetical protein
MIKDNKKYGRNPLSITCPKPQVIALPDGTFIILRPNGSYEISQ